jgi:hypothetical protein
MRRQLAGHETGARRTRSEIRSMPPISQEGHAAWFGFSQGSNVGDLSVAVAALQPGPGQSGQIP